MDEFNKASNYVSKEEQKILDTHSNGKNKVETIKFPNGIKYALVQRLRSKCKIDVRVVSRMYDVVHEVALLPKYRLGTSDDGNDHKYNEYELWFYSLNTSEDTRFYDGKEQKIAKTMGVYKLNVKENDFKGAMFVGSSKKVGKACKNATFNKMGLHKIRI
jgi:hypothetical protein